MRGQPLRFEPLFPLIALQFEGPQGSGWASLNTAWLLPALIQQMAAQAAFLGGLRCLVPEDGPIGTGLDELLLSSRLIRDRSELFRPRVW